MFLKYSNSLFNAWYKISMSQFSARKFNISPKYSHNHRVLNSIAVNGWHHHFIAGVNERRKLNTLCICTFKLILMHQRCRTLIGSWARTPNLSNSIQQDVLWIPITNRFILLNFFLWFIMVCFILYFSDIKIRFSFYSVYFDIYLFIEWRNVRIPFKVPGSKKQFSEIF